MRSFKFTDMQEVSMSSAQLNVRCAVELGSLAPLTVGVDALRP